MATTRQRNAAKRNIRKATAAAKSTRTISNLPSKTRTALGKQGAKVVATCCAFIPMDSRIACAATIGADLRAETIAFVLGLGAAPRKQYLR